MEDQLIQISKINDFLYSPESLYLHSMYESFEQTSYKDSAQVKGSLNHEAIDTNTYSDTKKWLSGTRVYSEKYGLVGRIDQYNIQTGELVERKTTVKQIHTGYIYQLWAQMFALQEMGYAVKKLKLFSLSDNRNYPVQRPSPQEVLEFASTIESMRQFDPLSLLVLHLPDQKSHGSIYGELHF
jgi:CRISPR-associated exonuclease Cas4